MSSDSVVKLRQATKAAQSGRFPEMLATCLAIVDEHANDIAVLLDTGGLLSHFGFLSSARECYERALNLAPADLRALMNLANIARDAGRHREARDLYSVLQQQLPNHPVIRRNALITLEYDPDVPDEERLEQARAWGKWAVTRAGGARARPAPKSLAARPLRVGFVSADFCQHTVGLLVKDVLAALDKSCVTAFAYSAGSMDDWVTTAIRQACIFREVGAMEDAVLAEQIRQDGIDVLVDLSGHTAGSRLTAFAHRPAPVQISWLGYFATTGLSCMDAVFLDEWHAPPGAEAQFTERLIRLRGGRFCYQPVPFAPEISPVFTRQSGKITFGCFNNTAKLNDDVFKTWARILKAIPNARLVLKWRTFNDDTLRRSVLGSFAQCGIAAERVELRGPSFHADLLREYDDIDIALDPFPFTGGLTSCEALWMGVPVITWPRSRAVSRQTFAFLSAIGLPELAAKDADDYVRIAVELAADRERLNGLRDGLRAHMQASPLMNVNTFARRLEQAFIDLYREIETDKMKYAASG